MGEEKMKCRFPSGEFYDAAFEIVAELKRHGKKAFLIGGCVRDLLLGQVPHDFDITTSAPPQAIRLKTLPASQPMPTCTESASMPP